MTKQGFKINMNKLSCFKLQGCFVMWFVPFSSLNNAGLLFTVQLWNEELGPGHMGLVGPTVTLTKPSNAPSLLLVHTAYALSKVTYNG